jgi:2-polyprenyl-3-methyl-5-hydroxy-6-metoxy-1,4-benzoquinol methylase
MDVGTKRAASDTDVEQIQSGNRQWWTDNTMSYDWNDKVQRERFGQAWYDEIDRRFIHGARLFAHDREPFDRIIPFAALRDRDVLEIGCGMGLHSELMTRGGARVTSIDISDTSIEATRNRLTLKQLPANVQQMDARTLAFPDASFDFVWSWGVIHHSAQTAAIIREIARVLKPGGETRIMVYNIDGMSAYASIVYDYLFGFWRGRTIDDGLWKHSDGFMARHYSKDMLSDIMRLFFADVGAQSFGQDADGVPLPRQIRPLVMRLMSTEALARRANRRGSFLFMTARKSTLS